MRVLVLHHDAFGGRGGIAKFNRDLLTALASYPATEYVTALPRIIVEPVGALPPRLEYRTAAARGRAAFLLSELSLLACRQWYDLVICGHVYLLPLLWPLWWRAPRRLGLILHGLEAWSPPDRPAVRYQLSRLDWFLAVSQVTKERFLTWSGVKPTTGFVVPNAVDLARFSPGPKRADLMARYGLAGRTVLMGLGRLDARERAKGFDEVIDLLPRLLSKYPEIAYLICGDGTDRQRLEAKVRLLGLAAHVIFAGYVSEDEKVDHYRLADCFILAGWYEGFGIALIEAMACGVPAVASSLDGSCEAVGKGALGVVVDPRNQADLTRGIEEALARPRGIVPAGLARFSYESFEAQIHRLLLDPLAAKRAG